jgi:predicted O-methyltransferase YrrM
MTTGQFTLLISMLAGIAALLGVVLHKMRRIHVSLFGVAADAAEARRESRALFGQMQALLALERLLALRHRLPAMRGWAGSPDMLLAVAGRIIATKPGVVVECSSGVSTVVIARCCELNGGGHVYSLEHEAEYADKTRALLERHGLERWATVLHAPLTSGGDGAMWYRDSALPADLPPIDLLVIDGPPAGGDSQARFPAFPRLRPRLAAAATVMLDDADRPGERAIVQRWMEIEPGLRMSQLPAEKGLVMLERVA